MCHTAPVRSEFCHKGLNFLPTIITKLLSLATEGSMLSCEMRLTPSAKPAMSGWQFSNHDSEGFSGSRLSLDDEIRCCVLWFNSPSSWCLPWGYSVKEFGTLLFTGLNMQNVSVWEFPLFMCSYSQPWEALRILHCNCGGVAASCGVDMWK